MRRFEIADLDQPAGLTKADILQVRDILGQICETLFCLGHWLDEPDQRPHWLAGVRASASTMRYFAKSAGPRLIRDR